MAPTRSGAIVRRAAADEADALNAVIVRSKSYWGYAPAVVEAYRAFLCLEPEFIERNPVYCAEVDGITAGVSHFNAVGRAEIELFHLFVDPAFIGQGIGKLLWRHAVDGSRSMGGTALVFDSDPHARPFYERLGAVVVGDHESTVVAGLRIPRMRYEL
jgi:GNAT superfamily N-acetyltransferase